MTQDEIIRMATEVWGYSEWKGAALERLDRFAAIVAAHEREACAKVCDAILGENNVSAAIRART